MDAILIMLFIVGAVFVAAYFFRIGKDEDEAPEGRGTSRSAEIKRFLEEMERRRQGETGGPERAVERASEEPIKPVPRRQKARKPRPEPAVLTVLPVEEAPARSGRKSEKLPEKMLAREPGTLKDELNVRPVIQPRQKSRLLGELTPFLESASNMRAALMLQEILGPPRCMQSAVGYRPSAISSAASTIRRARREPEGR